MKNHNKFNVRPSGAFGSHHFFFAYSSIFFLTAYSKSDFTIAATHLSRPFYVFFLFCSIRNSRKSEFMNLNGLVYARKA